MTPTVVIAAVLVATLNPAAELPTKFWGISPEVTEFKDFKRKHDRAVVFIHGLLPRPLHPERAEKPEPHSWQTPNSLLVKGLADDFDVFGFSYAQTGPADLVAVSSGLRDGMAALKSSQYKEIALVGHSAGGLIARRFVELFPEAGVTKLVTIAAPYLGSGLAKLPTFVLPKPQVQFIQSLLPDYREARYKEWTCTVCEDVQFCCILCKLPRLDNDTVVALRSQWPEDLQRQGVSAVLVGCSHFDAMTGEKCTKAVQEVLRGKVVRWKPEEVTKARGALFGEK